MKGTKPEYVAQEAGIDRGWSKQHLSSRGNESEIQFLNSLSTVRLPKGRGIIHRTGEKFTPNPISGTRKLSMPITGKAQNVRVFAGINAEALSSIIKFLF